MNVIHIVNEVWVYINNKNITNYKNVKTLRIRNENVYLGLFWGIEIIIRPKWFI